MLDYLFSPLVLYLGPPPHMGELVLVGAWAAAARLGCFALVLALAGALVWLLLPLAAWAPRPAPPAARVPYEVLAEGAARTEIRGHAGITAETTIFVEPGTPLQDLRAIAARVLDDLVAQHGPVVRSVIYMNDTRFRLPVPWTLAVAYWQVPESLEGADRHGLALTFYPRRKVTDPDAIPRPTDDEIRFATLTQFVRLGFALDDEERAFAAWFAAQYSDEELDEIVSRVTRWLHY